MTNVMRTNNTLIAGHLHANLKVSLLYPAVHPQVELLHVLLSQHQGLVSIQISKPQEKIIEFYITLNNFTFS